MKKFDFLFIHPTTHLKKPYSSTEFETDTSTDFITYIVMPMGTMALADLLDREGYETLIIHSGIEQMYDRSFKIEDLFKKYDVSAVGIDLHWYVHSYDAIRIADIAKQLSNAFVVLGGFTASFFAKEILTRFQSVDAVICGDAEIPLLELVKQLKHRTNAKFEEVPNLVYRDRSLNQSERRYVADESDLDRLNFSNFSLLSNYEKYIKILSHQGDLMKSGTQLKTQGWSYLGRGCSMNCSYCGGGKNSFQMLTGRQTPIFRSKEKVVEELARFEEMKISCTYMDFDPYPNNRDYYHELFKLIRNEKIDISANFLLWSPCDKDFLSDFKQTFNPLYSTMVLSPESGSERIRQLNKGFYYDNEQLFRWLDDAKHEMIPIQIYFTSGLSGETEKHFEETINIGKKIVEEYPITSILCNSIDLEPASPRFLDPEKYEISLKFKDFNDFYNTFKELAENFPPAVSSVLGYRTNYLSERQIIELKQRFQKTIFSAIGELWEKRSEFGNQRRLFQDIRGFIKRIQRP